MRELEDKSRMERFNNPPIEAGIAPTRRLECPAKMARFVNPPSVDVIVPVKEFPPKLIWVRDVRVQKEEGIGPPNRLLDTINLIS